MEKDRIEIIKRDGVFEKLFINGVEAKCAKKIEVKENFDFLNSETEVLIVFSNLTFESVDN